MDRFGIYTCLIMYDYIGMMEYAMIQNSKIGYKMPFECTYLNKDSIEREFGKME